LQPGSLLFHNWQESHYNIKPEGFTRGFHIEMEPRWFADSDLDLHHLQGSISIAHPDIKLLMYQIFRESKIEDNITDLSIQTLLTDAFSRLNRIRQNSGAKPNWVSTLDEILNEEFAENLTLAYLSAAANIHPVHLSRDFSKYFHCNLGDYIRKIRVEKAIALLSGQKIPLAEIAYRCGFFDQSHMIRCFKAWNGQNPSAFRKMLQHF